MRLLNLIKGEIKFDLKYGIFYLYIVFTLLYLCVIALIPQNYKAVAAAILVFTDPAAMGLFFMGAIVLFEKSQRIQSSLVVSPIKLYEYVIAKVLPLSIISVVMGLILCLFAGAYNIALIIVAVFISSVLFSLIGLIVSSFIKSLNDFAIYTVPFEIALCLPAILYLFKVLKSDLWIIHPGIAAIKLISGDLNYWYLSLLSLVLWIVPLFFITLRFVRKSFLSLGGAKI